MFDGAFPEMSQRLGIPLRWNRSGAMGSLFFSEDPVVDWPSAADASADRFNAFFHGMLERGIHLPPSRFEAWFWSYAHTREDIERTIGIAEDATFRPRARAWPRAPSSIAAAASRARAASAWAASSSSRSCPRLAARASVLRSALRV